MEHVSGNIFVRDMRFDRAGDVVGGHKHNFDHTTYVVRGGIRVEHVADDGTILRAVEKRASDGKNWVLIRAGARHRITALEDGTLAHCIYSHRTPQGEIVQEHTGWPDAYS